eukprot:scaffold8740_cov113-Cylindrotheca_fusiformis.AAC.7
MASCLFFRTSLGTWRNLYHQRCRSPFSSGRITSELKELVEAGDKIPDHHQLDAAAELDRLYEDLLSTNPPSQPVANQESSSSSSSSLFGTWFGAVSSSPVAKLIKFHTAPTGAYLHGGVGCGKTFLMNILYHSVDSGPWAQDKQLVHYHKFMLTVHHHMHKERQLNPTGDLIAPVVDRILENGRLLCLDEFQVTDVADALILQRLFEGLWNHGCVLVATSNRPARDLYLHGLQRDRFIPFIDLLERKCAIINMMDSELDYRMTNPFAQGDHPVYFSKGQTQAFQALFDQVVAGTQVTSTTLQTQGRHVKIPMASVSKRVAQFSFIDLCEKAMGAADYLVIAQNFETVFCHSVPKLSIHHVNWLRRFITFIDSMYELKVTLVLQTDAASIDDIFVIENKMDYIEDEVFAFDRCRSRLEEMASPKYLSQKWQGSPQ